MVEKQNTGFRYGRYSLSVLRTIGEVKHKGRTYRLCEVQTQDGLVYLSLRLYNPRGHFIKQMLVEPEVVADLARRVQEAQI